MMPLTAKPPRKWRGFTLVELLITMVIAGILATIAVPSYQNHVQKARRANAYSCLLDTAQRQENFFYQNNRYTTNIGELGLPNANCGEGGHYTLTVAAGTSGSINTSYLLTASRASTASNRPVWTSTQAWKTHSQGRESLTSSGSVSIHVSNVANWP